MNELRRLPRWWTYDGRGPWWRYTWWWRAGSFLLALPIAVVVLAFAAAVRVARSARDRR